MNRLLDYASFAVWFVGLGYMVIWPLSVNGASGALFGAPILCGTSAPLVLMTLCHAPHPLTLSPTLHALGSVSAAAVTLRLVGCAWRRARRLRTTRLAEARAPQIPGPLMPPPPPRSPRLPRVKPRSQFGLRGMSR